MGRTDQVLNERCPIKFNLFPKLPRLDLFPKLPTFNRMLGIKRGKGLLDTILDASKPPTPRKRKINPDRPPPDPPRCGP